MAANPIVRSAGHDVVVVGGGTAGCLTAARLVGAGLDVAVIEAGPEADVPVVEDATRALEIPFSPLDWCYLSVPQPRLGGRSVPCAAGRVLGGSSSINNTIFIRGSAADYNAWAESVDEWWRWENVVERFRGMEDFDGGPSALRGIGGSLPIASCYEHNPIMDAFVEAAEAAGLPRSPDLNSGELDGVGFLQFNLAGGLRKSSWSAFLRPLREAPNLTLITDANAHGLLFEGERCTGVEVERQGRIERVRANQEVVLAAGAFATPKLLLLSGIGPAEHLREIGIKVRVDLPGVGTGLQDHMLAVATHSASRPVPPPAPGAPPYQVAAFVHTGSGVGPPDIQFQAVQHPFVPGLEGMPEHGFTLMCLLNQPLSRGSLRLAAADPTKAPLIDPAYLTEETDREALARGLGLARRILSHDPIAEWLDEELSPGPAVADRELGDHVLTNSWSFYHPVGSCAMGHSADAPLDPQLRVRGTIGLRVADASAMPKITSANTHAPTLMIGERAADAILSGE